MNQIALIVAVLALILGSIGIYLQTTPSEPAPPSETPVNETPGTDTNVAPEQDDTDASTRSGRTVIDLSGQGLTKTPAYVFNRTDTEVLDLSDNQLDGALQAEVRHLARLRELDLSHNRFTGVPAEIGQLHELEILDLSYNELTGLPHELGNLGNLRRLDLRGNDYSTYDLDIIRNGLPSSATILTD